MKKFFRKTLIYLVISMLLLPTWIATGMMKIEHAKANGATTLVGWNFPNDSADTVADGGEILANLSKNISTAATGTISYDAGSSTQSISSTGWQDGMDSKYWQVSFSTAGYDMIKVSSKQRSSNTGPRDFKLRYKVGAGEWADVIGGGVLADADDFTSGVLTNLSLPAGVDDQADVYLRWIMTSNIPVGDGTVVGSSGTSKIDDIVVTGVLIPDTTKPIITINPLDPNPTNQDPVELTGTVTDAGSGVNTATYEIKLISTDTSVDSGLLALGELGNFLISNNLSDGAYRLTVNAADIAGNEDSKTYDFTVDLNRLDLSDYLGGGDTVTLPAGSDLVIIIETTNGNVQLTIPAGTVITGPVGWDGKINLAQIVSISGVQLPAGTGMEATGAVAFEFGAGLSSLSFDQPVKLVFYGAGGKRIGYFKDGGFIEITVECDDANPPANIPTNGECKKTVGNDLVVWTTHFTTFANYSEQVAVLTITVAKNVAADGRRILTVNWKGIGNTTKYEIYVNGITSESNSVNVAGDDTGTDYSKTINIASDGKYDVYVKAIRGDGSLNSNTAAVEFAAPSPAVTTTTQTTAPTVPLTSVAPAKAEAQAPAPSAVAESQTGDQSGQIKGEETSTSPADEKINWTPWIILFVLILLTGAATGGYFYWFSGEDEVETTVKQAKSEIKAVVKPETKPKVKAVTKPDKKSKRW